MTEKTDEERARTCLIMYRSWRKTRQHVNRTERKTHQRCNQKPYIHAL